ncbi:MAG TPA: hypothetical protein ENN33_02440 [Ignavibacteria bacterium]|nr:hypothetical protein [Ignavibacteria bacterium]
MQIQPIDITQIIVAIITAASVVYSAQQHRKLQEKQKPEVAPRKINTWTIVTCIGVIFLTANLGIFGLRYWGSPTGVEITFPYDGATVEIREMILGTSQKIPEGQAIWIVVYPHVAGRYYPQNDPADVQTNGDWISLAFIGIQEDVNRKFDIVAVLADESAQEAFNAYLTQAKGNKTWPGFEKLPEGTAIYDRITVARK